MTQHKNDFIHRPVFYMISDNFFLERWTTWVLLILINRIIGGRGRCLQETRIAA